MDEIQISTDDRFAVCGNSVELINTLVNNLDPDMTERMSQQDKNDIINANVNHLIISSNQDWYINDIEAREAPANKNSISESITAGNTYLSENQIA